VVSAGRAGVGAARQHAPDYSPDTEVLELTASSYEHDEALDVDRAE
jgi:hypothetical protein